MARAKKREPRLVHVECATPTGYRWLRTNVRGATPLEQGKGFLVTDEGTWAEYLRMAEGKEI